MTPPWLAFLVASAFPSTTALLIWIPRLLMLVLSAVEAAVAYRLYKRIYWQRYRGFMAYLLCEMICHAIGAKWYGFAAGMSQPARMAIRFWVAREIFQFGCVRFSKRERLRLAGEAVLLSATAAWLVDIFTGLPPRENFIVFRGYYHVILAAALWWITFRVRRSRTAENTDHTAYRWGMVRWLSVVALDGLYWVAPLSKVVMWYVHVLSLILLVANAAWMGWKMTSTISCLRPDVAYRGVRWC